MLYRHSPGQIQGNPRKISGKITVYLLEIRTRILLRKKILLNSFQGRIWPHHDLQVFFVSYVTHEKIMNKSSLNIYFNISHIHMLIIVVVN